MAELILGPKAILNHLIELSKFQAEAMGWVCQRDAKITLKVPDAYVPRMSDDNCFAGPLPHARKDAEILIGLLKKMSKKGHRRPRPKQSK